MISFAVNIILLILVLGLLILIHELGHFIAAKLSNVRVDAFAIGMGPNIFKKKYGETEYRLNILPIGGYVSILGEVPDEDDPEYQKDKNNPRNFQNKNPLTKIFILVAGVTMNLLTAVIIYYVFLSMSSFSFIYPSEVPGYTPLFGTVKAEILDDLFYSELSEDGNAIQYDWPEEGYVLAMGSSDLSLNPIIRSDEFSDFAQSHKSETIYVKVCAEPEDTVSCGVYDVEVSEDGKVGILLNNNYVQLVEYEGIERVFGGFTHSLNMIHLAGVHIGNIFADASDTGDYSDAVNTFSGPVGLYFIIDFMKGLGILGLLDLIANMSLVLFVMNLLPIPALDGGRIVLVLTEWVMGEKFNKSIEAWLIRISFALLMLFMLAVFVKDFLYLDKLRELFA